MTLAQRTNKVDLPNSAGTISIVVIGTVIKLIIEAIHEPKENFINSLNIVIRKNLTQLLN